MDIPFDPNLHIGPIAIAWHGIFTAVGIFFGVGLPVRLLRGPVAEDAAYSVATWGVVGGIVGARAVHVIDAWPYYQAHPEQIPLIWSGGIAVWGAAIGGVLAGYLVARRRGDVPIGLTADAAAPGIGLGFAIGRIGDVINGEHHAVSCRPPLGICVTYSHPDTLGQGLTFGPTDPRFWPDPVHLAVAYDMAWVALTVLLALWLWRERERGRPALWRLPQGAIFWIWLFLYGAGRLVISTLRTVDPEPLLGLRQDQLIGLLAMLVSLAVLAWLLRRARGAERVAV